MRKEVQGFKHLDGSSDKTLDKLQMLIQMNDLDSLSKILNSGQYVEDMKFAIEIEDKVTGKKYAIFLRESSCGSFLVGVVLRESLSVNCLAGVFLRAFFCGSIIALMLLREFSCFNLIAGVVLRELSRGHFLAGIVLREFSCGSFLADFASMWLSLLKLIGYA